MTDPIQNPQAVSAVLATDSAQDKLESNSKRKIAQELLKESTNYSTDAKSKQEQAKQYLQAAEVLEKLAAAVRQKAEALKKGKVEEETEALAESIEEKYQIPVPKNASPELLEEIARTLEAKAKENRQKANELLRQSEESEKFAKQLKEQAEFISKNEIGFDELKARAAQAHNEGLALVFKKLGIYKLDAEYKEQVAYAKKKEAG